MFFLLLFFTLFKFKCAHYLHELFPAPLKWSLVLPLYTNLTVCKYPFMIFTFYLSYHFVKTPWEEEPCLIQHWIPVHSSTQLSSSDLITACWMNARKHEWISKLHWWITSVKLGQRHFIISALLSDFWKDNMTYGVDMPSISQKLSQESFFWITSPVLDLGFLSRYIFFFTKKQSCLVIVAYFSST